MPVLCGLGEDWVALEGAILDQLSVDTSITTIVDVLDR